MLPLGVLLWEQHNKQQALILHVAILPSGTTQLRTPSVLGGLKINVFLVNELGTGRHPTPEVSNWMVRHSLLAYSLNTGCDQLSPFAVVFFCKKTRTSNLQGSQLWHLQGNHWHTAPKGGDRQS